MSHAEVDRDVALSHRHHGPTHGCVDGVIEYRGAAFGGRLDGCMMVVRYSGGKDILVVRLGADGKVVETIARLDGLTGFADPLDLVEDPANGALYIAELAGQKLTLLRPMP